MNGADAESTISGLYDYIGSVVGQLDALIDAELARQAPPAKPKKRHLF
jgi:hypothetical protein